MSQGALVGGIVLMLCASSSVGAMFLMMNQSTRTSDSPTPSSTPSSTSTPPSTPTPPPPALPPPPPALPPPPPSPSSYFNATCADLGGGSDIISASNLDDCMNLCRTNGHGYPYSCKGLIYGSSFDGYSPFCRIYNNKDLDHGTQICEMGLKTYTLK